MRKLIFFIILIFLLIPLASALKVTTDKDSYSINEEIKIQVSDCNARSFVTVLNSRNNLVYMDLGERVWATTYHTSSDSSTGEYVIKATCGSNEIQKIIGVGITYTPVVNNVQEVASSQGSSGGGGCYPEWSCDSWSFCNATLEQSRKCIDLRGCRSPKIMVQECSECIEYWICGLWTECSNGIQTRTCVDEHACRTTKLKPALQRNCNEPVSGPAPVSINQNFGYQAPITQQPTLPEKTFFEKFSKWIIGLTLGIFLIIITIVLVIHFFVAKHKVAYNLSDLKEWILKEKEMGTTDEGIKEILEENTGWTKEEIDDAFLKAEQ